jgi:hypothetical protein
MITLVVLVLGGLTALADGLVTSTPWSWLSWAIFLAVIVLAVITATADITDYRKDR